MGKVKHKHSHAHLLFSNLLFVEQPQFLSKRNDNLAPPVHSSTSDDNTLEELITVSKLCSFSFFFLTPHQMKRCYHRISRYQQKPWQVQQYPSGGLADACSICSSEDKIFPQFHAQRHRNKTASAASLAVKNSQY